MNQRPDDLPELPREMQPPPWLETQVVASLRSEGLLASRRRRVSRAIVGVAAALIIFAGGVGAGLRLADVGPGDATSGPVGGQYALLLYDGPDFERAPPDDPTMYVREYGSWASNLAQRGALDGAGELGPGAIALDQGDDGEVVERPVSSANSGTPSGFFLIRAEDPTSALSLTRTHPHLGHGGRIDVHPVVGGERP